MSDDQGSHLEKAAECWQSGQALEAGRLVFENLPREVRPDWASSILKMVIHRSGVRRSYFEPVLETSRQRSLWKQGHRVFDRLRGFTLQLEKASRRSEEEELLLHHLYLAENVVKVIYNATDPPDEFDEDSGWWILPCLQSILDLLDDEEFSKAAWLTVCRERAT